MLRVGDELITLIDPDAPASEAYRTLRTNILMRNFDTDMKVINIISTTAQEGKTTCVLNLAMVYAQLQKRVLVIDLDLRMPTIHKKLKLKNKKGISDIIGHQAEFEEVVLQPYEYVDVITAGTKIPFASEFIQSNALKEFIEERKKEYDLILLDCPPVGLVTDGIVAAAYCDGTILVCASNRNDRKELLRVKDQLEQTQVNVIGIVMTMMPVQRKYYNSYGYRYSDTQKKTSQKKKKNSIISNITKKSDKKEMIDIHSHLNPGVDDGSQSLEESLSLLRQAEEDGITEVITTPHFMKNGEFRTKASKLVQRFNELKLAYKGSIKLHLGNELYIHPDLPELLEQGEVLTLNESNYILVEFPFQEYKEDYDEILYELSLKYRIIIAHPERYSYVRDDPNFCFQWLNDGYLLQANQNSLFKKETKKVLVPMMEHGFISFIASDAHNEYRPCVLSEVRELLSEEFGERFAVQLTEENPEKILKNEPIVQEYREIKKKKKHFLWL